MARHKKEFNPCAICLSKYRYQIEQAWQSEVRKKDIADKYTPLLKYSRGDAFVSAAKRHMIPKHFKESKKFPYFAAPPGSEHALTKTSLEDLAQGLMDIGGNMVDYYKKNPLIARKELRIIDVLKAQDVVTNRMKVANEQDALKLMMGKMFGGFMPEVVDGEVVDESEGTLLE